ncbi:MAG: GNAT family N-acetyltransferase [Aminipila sp.]
MSKEIHGLIRIKDKKKAMEVLLETHKDFSMLKNAFPHRDRYILALSVTLRTQIPFFIKYGDVYSDSPRCDGVALVIHSGKRKPSKIKYFLSGCYWRKYKNSEGLLSKEENERRIKVYKETEQMEADIQFPKKYIYINYIGVKSEFRNQGIENRIIEKLMEEGIKKTLPIVLYTNEPDNVAFYQDLGFKIIGITSSKTFQFMNIYLIKE